MAMTNDQVERIITRIVENGRACMAELAQRTQADVEALTAQQQKALAAFMAQDTAAHDEFRRTISDLTQRQAQSDMERKLILERLAQDGEAHSEFRAALAELAKHQIGCDGERKLMLEKLNQHGDNWKQLWKLAVVPVLGAVVAAVMAAIGLIG